MTDTEIDGMIRRLTARASGKLKRRVWRGEFGGAVAGGKTAVDIVTDAIIALAEGDRARNKIRYPTLEAQLESIVDSLVSNLVTGSDNKSVERCENLDIHGASENAEEKVINSQLVTRIHDELINIVLEDDLMLAAVDLLMKEARMMPADYQERLGLTLTDANNLKKRLRRALDSAIAAVEGNRHGR